MYLQFDNHNIGNTEAISYRQQSKKKCCKCQADLIVFLEKMKSEKLVLRDRIASGKPVDFGCPFELA